jgi:hypothetical protein
MTPIPRRYAIAVLAGVAALAVLAGRQPKVDPLMTDFAGRDPVLDARAALSRGDHRLLGGEYGWGLRVAGLRPDIHPSDSALILSHGVRIIARVSDAVSSDSEWRYGAASVEYATRYNSVIIGADRTHP